MKIYSTEPSGNQEADLEPALYFGLAIKKLNEETEYLKEADTPIQSMLVHLDMLIYIAKKYPDMANRRIKKPDSQNWKESFYNWYERCNSKIPKKFREGIKESADKLFAELEPLGTTWIG